MSKHRPNRHDPEIVEAAARKMIPDVKQWLNEGNPDQGEPTNDEHILHDLCKAMRWDSDGYEIAKRLDQAGWDPDDELVEILSNAAGKIRHEHQLACVEWVKTSGIQAPELHSTVINKDRTDNGPGTIIENHGEGRSTVSFEKLGHLPPGSTSVGTRGSVLDWENLIPQT